MSQKIAKLAFRLIPLVCLSLCSAALIAQTAAPEKKAEKSQTVTGCLQKGDEAGGAAPPPCGLPLSTNPAGPLSSCRTTLLRLWGRLSTPWKNRSKGATMVPVNGSHGGSQSSFEAYSEACESEHYPNHVCWKHVHWIQVCQAQAEAWTAGLDGARAGGVRS